MANSVADPQNVEMFIGAAKTLVVTMSPVVDTTGWTVTFYMRKSNGAPNYLVTKSCSVGGASGTITCIIDRADTLNMAEDTYSYEFVRSNAGDEDIVAYGALSLVYPKT